MLSFLFPVSFFMVLRHAKRIHLAIKGKSCYNTTEKLNLNMMG